MTNGAQKSSVVVKKAARRSSTETNFILFAVLSVLSLIIGLILLNWWLILLGGLGVSVIIFFIYILAHAHHR
jgi:1,4-dihydroxy-2-naphthoate octaprenyltransferase